MRYWRRKDGVALVEFALIALLFFALIFGIVEFGIIYFQHLSLSQAAREASRAASIGRARAMIIYTFDTMVSGMVDPALVNVTLMYSLDNGQTFPCEVGDNSDGTKNAVPAGGLISVSAEYPHSLVAGSFFSFLSGVEDGRLPLRTQAIMRRE